METLDPSPDLAELVETCRDEIRNTWIDLLRHLPESHYPDIPEGDLEAWTSASLQAISASLRKGDKQPLIDHAVEMSRSPDLAGLVINEVVEGLLLLREAVYPCLRERSHSIEPDLFRLLRRFDLALRVLIARLAKLFAEATSESLAAERDRTAFLLDATGAATESLDLSVVLPTVAHSIKNALGYSLCCIYLWHPESEDFSPCATAGQLADDRLITVLHERLDPKTNSFAEDALLAREISIFGPASGCRFGSQSCRDLGISVAAVLPIRLADRLLAFALAIDTDPAPELDSHALVLASAIATSVAPAVDNARRYDETRRLLSESQKLQRAGEALLGMQDFEDLLGIICREIENLTGAAGSAVLLGEEGAVSPRVFKHEAALPMSEDQLLSNGAPGPARVSLPLTIRNHSLGDLVVIGPDSGLDDDDLRLAHDFTNQAAIAIQHALLHRQHEQLAAHVERQRLAHDLHDTITQSMYGLSMHGEAAARLLEAGQIGRASEVMRDLGNTARDTLREMRLVIFELRPPILEDQGLVAALENRLSVVEGRAGLQTDLAADPNLDIPIRPSETLYAIAKEALNNVLRHARATRVTVRLTRSPSGTVMEIQDDGVGFDETQTEREGGLGLKGMKERAAEAGGQVAVTTSPGRGTVIRAEIPIQARRIAGVRREVVP